MLKRKNEQYVYNARATRIEDIKCNEESGQDKQRPPTTCSITPRLRWPGNVAQSLISNFIKKINAIDRCHKVMEKYGWSPKQLNK